MVTRKSLTGPRCAPTAYRCAAKEIASASRTVARARERRCLDTLAAPLGGKAAGQWPDEPGERATTVLKCEVGDPPQQRRAQERPVGHRDRGHALGARTRE